MPPRGLLQVSSERQHSSSTILFTAFEPSGDSHAAPIIRALREQFDGVEVYAWGGPKMEKAGATMIEHSAIDGAMGLGALSRVRAVRRHIRAIARWSRQTRVLVHVPVDSPAANFPICRIMRKRGARTVHLVAPQLWAWGGWRIGKLRRRTDHLLCLLPFEEAWFRQRRIRATFIGHPAINRDIEPDDLHAAAAMLPQGAPKLAIFPGSRRQEVRKNIRLMVAAYAELHARHSDLCAIVVCDRKEILHDIKRRFDILPTGLHVVAIDPDAAIYWCDCALTVSGTMSLDITRQVKPMVGVYRVSHLSKLLSFLILRTKYRLLPNIIAKKKIVPEFVPYAGGHTPIVRAASPILGDTKVGAKQSADLVKVRAAFDGKQPGLEGARLIMKLIRGEAIG